MYTHCRRHYITSTTTILGASLGPQTPAVAAAFRRTTMFITQPALARYDPMNDKMSYRWAFRYRHLVYLATPSLLMGAV